MHGQQKPLSVESAFQQYTQSSGSGSSVAYAAPYVKFLAEFISKVSFQSILDLGCGDLVLMDEVFKLVRTEIDDLTPAYLGIDALHRRVQLNHEQRPHMLCAVGDVRAWSPHIGADLVICKDVLQHWSNDEIVDWLENAPACKAMLVTNCARGGEINSDIVMGDWRPIDLTAEPFNAGEVVFQWGTKDVVLIQ